MHGRCDQSRLVDALRDLFSVYYQPDETTAMRARQIALFVKDMAEFSDDCAFWAIDEWRRTQDRRPSPASLRHLAMTRKQEAFSAAKRSAPRPAPEPAYVEPDPAKRAQNLQRIGFAMASLASAHDAERRNREAPHWSHVAAPNDPRLAQLEMARKANPLMNPETN